MYKKTYLGFWLWLIGMCAALVGSIFLPIPDMKILMTVFDNVMVLSMFLLTFIIYKTEYVYWYTGITYETAEEAGSDRRRAYAFEYVKRFGVCAVAFIVYSVISILVRIPFGVDIAVANIGIVAAAISTVWIKL